MAEMTMSRLRWLCRRGMKELDIAMESYLDNHYAAASEADRSAFGELLQMQDPNLYALIAGKEQPSNEAIDRVIQAIRLSSSR